MVNCLLFDTHGCLKDLQSIDFCRDDLLSLDDSLKHKLFQLLKCKDDLQSIKVVGNHN